MSYLKPAFVLLGCMLTPISALAQPGRDYGGGDRGGDRDRDRGGYGGGDRGGYGGPGRGGPGFGGSGGPGGYSGRGGPPSSSGGPGGFDPTEMLSRMDANQNGKLDGDELSERTKYMISRISERAGVKIDTSRDVSLESLSAAFKKASENSDRDNRDDDRQSNSEPEIPQVHDFKLDDQMVLVPGFDIPDDSPLLQSGPLEDRYDQRIMEQVERRLREYDTNKDGLLDQSELSKGRWSPDPKEADLNGDGKLNKLELAERYAKRYGSNEKAASNSKSKPVPVSLYGLAPAGSSSGSKSSGSASSSSSESSDDKVKKYADSLMKQYDKNKNDVLEREEWQQMSNSPERSDSNRDGKISRSELEARLSSYYKSSGSSNKSSTSSGSSGSALPNAIKGDYRFSTTDELLAKAGISGSSDFIRKDANGDGQIQMAEFASDWDDDKFAEFQELDQDGDGVITPAEWNAVQN